MGVFKDRPDLDTITGRKDYYTNILHQALAVVPTSKWNRQGSKFNVNNNAISLIATEHGVEAILAGGSKEVFKEVQGLKGFIMKNMKDSILLDGDIVAGEGSSMDGIPYGLYVSGGKKYRGFEITSEENGLRKGFYRFYNLGNNGGRVLFGNSARDGEFSKQAFEKLVGEGKIRLLDSAVVGSGIKDAPVGAWVEIELSNGRRVRGEVVESDGDEVTVKTREGVFEGYKTGAGRYVANDSAFSDAEDFSKKTKQGFDVIELYRDGGRLHAIFKRSNDYGIAFGYDTSDGQWAQGMYDYGSVEAARSALRKTKPYARLINDAATVYAPIVDATRSTLIEKLRTVSVPYGERYQVTEGSGWSFDLQHHGRNTYEEITKYPRVSPKEESLATLRFWYNGTFMMKFEGPINKVKADGIFYLKSQMKDSVVSDDETVGEFDLDTLPSENGEQKVKLHTGGKVIEVEVESEEHEREERMKDSSVSDSYKYVHQLKRGDTIIYNGQRHQITNINKSVMGGGRDVLYEIDTSKGQKFEYTSFMKVRVADGGLRVFKVKDSSGKVFAVRAADEVSAVRKLKRVRDSEFEIEGEAEPEDEDFAASFGLKLRKGSPNHIIISGNRQSIQRFIKEVGARESDGRWIK